MKTWEVILSKCPYCGEDLNISSLNSNSERESIGNVITMSKSHFNKCRGNDNRKLADIKTRIIVDIKGTKCVSWNYNKILS
jgi:hypothetical protein